MDPCCGSGHFLVEAFSMLWQMRAEEEGLAPVDAQDAVLRDNLFGLELDPRCVQIAMFAVALQAWKAGGGWRQLPVPNIACSGIPVKAPVEEWKALAGGDQRLENALVRLHILFRDADTLGSLIDPKQAAEIGDPTDLQGSFEDVEWDEIAPLLERGGTLERADPAIGVLGADASGLARAADFLSRRYVLQATNVPYLARSNQSQTLADFCSSRYPAGAPNLGTSCLERMCDLGEPNGSIATVSPQNWLFQFTFQKFRRGMFGRYEFASVARLGPGAFETISGEVVNVHLSIFHIRPPMPGHEIETVDLTAESSVRSKGTALRLRPFTSVRQEAILGQATARFTAAEPVTGERIIDRCDVAKGLGTGDRLRFIRQFWEVDARLDAWEYLQSAREAGVMSGRSQVILWEDESGALAAWARSVSHLNHAAQAWRVGKPLWGSRGVAVNLLHNLRATPYFGDRFEPTISVIVPRDAADIAPLWAFCQSDEFVERVREINPKLSVETVTLQELPFDVGRWSTVAAEADPLPEPSSDDPAQWLFEGRPEASTAPLQVAVARLLGYRWPEQAESDDLDAFADADGIVCLPAVAG